VFVAEMKMGGIFNILTPKVEMGKILEEHLDGKWCPEDLSK